MTVTNKMMALVVVAIIPAITVHAQTLFTYGNHAVSKEEFLKAFNKNNTEMRPTEKAYRDYLELYTRFKLKVQAALDQHLDTLTSQRNELNNFRSQVVETYMSDEASIAALLEEAAERRKKNIHIAHIFIPLKHNATPEEAKAAEEKIRKAYDELSKGAGFEKVALAYSVDSTVKVNKGDIGYITALTLPYALENLAYSTPAGKFSRPVHSKNGWHIFLNRGEREDPGTVRVAHILLMFPPGINDEQKHVLEQRADSIYRALEQGADFKTLALKYSSDNLTYQAGGEMPEFGVSRYSTEFENAAFALRKDGDIGKPLLTSYGYHIIKRLARNALPPDTSKKFMDNLRQQVLMSDRMEVAHNALAKKIMKQTGFKRLSINEAHLWATADSLLGHKPLPSFTDLNNETPVFSLNNTTVKVGHWLNYLETIRNHSNLREGKTDADLLEQFIANTAFEYYRGHLENYNKDFAWQLNEFKEGNLLFEIMQREVWGVASSDTAGLKKYYEAHLSHYWWEASADAVIFTCSNDSVAAAVRKKLAKGYHLWRQIADLSHGAVQADSGRFDLAQIPVAERTSFKTGLITADVRNTGDNTITFAYIVKLYRNRELRRFTDARGLVINDYQQFLEEKWLAELKKQYSVTVNEEVFRSLPASTAKN